MNETPSRPAGRSSFIVVAIVVAVIAVPFFLKPHNNSPTGSATPTGNLSAPPAAGKLVMYDFYTDWCGWCKKLDAEVYPQADVQKAMQAFEFRKVNAEGDSASRALAAKYNVTGFPTIVFVDSKGTEIHRITGYEPADQFAAEVNDVATKAGR